MELLVRIWVLYAIFCCPVVFLLLIIILFSPFLFLSFFWAIYWSDSISVILPLRFVYPKCSCGTLFLYCSRYPASFILPIYSVMTGATSVFHSSLCELLISLLTTSNPCPTKVHFLLWRYNVLRLQKYNSDRDNFNRSSREFYWCLLTAHNSSLKCVCSFICSWKHKKAGEGGQLAKN